MPAKTEKQARFMRVVRATQEGEMKHPSKAAREAASSMTPEQVREFTHRRKAAVRKRMGSKKS